MAEKFFVERQSDGTFRWGWFDTYDDMHKDRVGDKYVQDESDPGRTVYCALEGRLIDLERRLMHDCPEMAKKIMDSAYLELERRKERERSEARHH